MNREIYVSAYELSLILGDPLPNVLAKIHHKKIVFVYDHEIKIPLSQFYPDSWQQLLMK
ncbi:MAG: hypothetical protein RR590_10610 [Hungatella sp.]